MAKFKPIKAKSKSAPAPQGAVSCVVLVISGIVLVLIFLYFVLKYANG